MALRIRAARMPHGLQRATWVWPPARRGPALATLGIVLLGLFVWLHVWRLAQTPGWDPQEGYNLDIAWNLLHGQARLFALRTAFAQHPPLFFLQLALVIRILGYSMVAVRALAAMYAVLTCVALLGLGRRMLGAGPALWGGLVFTVAPLLLANTRWGYSYAQLAFVGVLVLWAAWRFDQAHAAHWLTIAAVLAGVAALSDYVGVAWIVFVAFAALRRGPRASVVALGIGLGVLGLGLLACLLAAPSVFLADAGDTLGRATGGNPLAQPVALLLNYYRFLSFDPWIVLGVVGLFCIRGTHARGMLLGATALLALVVLKVRPVGPSIHTAVPLLPLLALGAGVALDSAVRTLYGWSLRWLAAVRVPRALPPRLVRLGATLTVFLVVVAPVGMALGADLAGLATTLPTQQDATLATPGDARATIAWVLAHAQRGDLVLASPELAWRFDNPSTAAGVPGGISGADLLQALAQSGQTAAFYPGDLPASRWAYAVTVEHARYVIVDNLVRRLATPDETATLVPLLAQVTRWPVVFQRGQYTVYARPAG